VQRLLFALLLALCLHAIFIVLKFPGITTLPPRLAGEESIAISLSSTVIPTQKSEKSTQEETEKVREKPEEDKVEESLVPVPEIPLREKLTDDSPLLLKRRAVKKTHNTASSSNARDVRPQNRAPRKEEIPQAAVPVSVKASPLYTKNPKPEYPSLARRRNWQGTVILSVSVSAKGEANSVTIETSSGYTLLDNSALKTVASWQFLPGTESGLPVAMEVFIPVHFKLR